MEFEGDVVRSGVVGGEADVVRRVEVLGCYFEGEGEGEEGVDCWCYGAGIFYCQGAGLKGRLVRGYEREVGGDVGE